jgi:hypothetical protein
VVGIILVGVRFPGRRGTILKGMIGVTPPMEDRTDISPGVAVLLLVGFSIAMIVLTMLLFSQMEFRQKA